MKLPLPIFDDIQHIDDHDFKKLLVGVNNKMLQDYTHARAFLKSYNGSQGTFNGSVASVYKSYFY